ncbi:hypothetical protein [Neisseria animalis]|uniref:Uncharacterized protein n=1 Tax=Neisseria animalis TaxID=492 RepID=A0A5P3MT32_NEIAN|nr:hypothetical protein [Neisseria animalis]QEY24776.1 hypothetical protein D0T90_10115 [Neisseria animalis]ROW31823.1 hypothetical protein CGZ60_08050 [Neisseria animalis]VEE07739.1 Membrane protein [Neisseria animalis]
MTDRQTNPQTPEEQAAKTKKAKAKIRTVRIWTWIVMSLLISFFFLSKCAMTKPEFKQSVIDSCVKNIPFSEKWQADLKAQGLEGQGNKVIADYCVCMWDEPLEKLSYQQVENFGKLSAQEQVDLLGGSAAFEDRDRRCVAGLKAK